MTRHFKQNALCRHTSGLIVRVSWLYSPLSALITDPRDGTIIATNCPTDSLTPIDK